MSSYDVFDSTYAYRKAALLPYVHHGLYAGEPQPARLDDVVIFAAVEPEKTEFDRVRAELADRGAHVSTRNLLLALDRLSGCERAPVQRAGKWCVRAHAKHMHANVRAVLKWDTDDLRWLKKNEMRTVFHVR